MNDTPKWLLPAALAAGLGLLLWWLFEPDEVGNTGLAKLQRKPPDPYAGLGAAACMGGLLYYGGTTGGMAGAPICSQVGEAVAPVLRAGANGVVELIDAHGNVIRAAGQTTASAIRDTYGATKTVAGDVYSGGKTVVKDTYNFSKDAAGWVSGVTPAKKVAHFLGSLF